MIHHNCSPNISLSSSLSLIRTTSCCQTRQSLPRKRGQPTAKEPILPRRSHTQSRAASFGSLWPLSLSLLTKKKIHRSERAPTADHRPGSFWLEGTLIA